MSKLENKIEAQHRNLSEILNAQKYTVDYFQREYSWGKQQMEDLIVDLISAFENEYTSGDKRRDVASYNSYYLGPFVVSEKSGKHSIIDGQQRITSLTLFLIFLNHLRKELCHDDDDITSMIFSNPYGEKSFNIAVEERESCLKALFDNGNYTPLESDDESAHNMSARYQEIEGFVPDNIKGDAFLHFVDWLRFKVVMVEIKAYSDENAYTIFETMNDRGLSLTSSEMLKGFILSNFDDTEKDKRDEINGFWKETMLKLKFFSEDKFFSKDEDQRFFQAWLRAQYAETIRQSKEGSEPKDFEKIGTRFHGWVRDNLEKMNLVRKDSATFYPFINIEFRFYQKFYVKILEAEKTLNPKMENVFYIYRWGIARTLSFPLMLASLQVGDTDDMVFEKINTVARYIETFAVRRSVNKRHFSASSIRHTMCNLAKEIRRKDLAELKRLLSEKLEKMDEKFDGMDEFSMHGQNKNFVKFLLSRMTAWIENKAGKSTNFSTYYEPERGKLFEVEHIWANKFGEHGHDEEFDDNEFKEYRNRLGGLVLLQRGTNQSLGDMSYEKKVERYFGENLLASSLCANAYENNPSFTRDLRDDLGLPFAPHESFKKEDLDKRQGLYRAICEQIWPQEL